ncbi:MAG: three-Cys-motif partner protein TcmP [SAR324 cluster bacterium]|nr:three-Cys-motif partner protein TcmP [SAR324 cluster bacterium]
MKEIKFDEIGYWTEIKLDIVRDYASAYSVIMNAPGQQKFYHVYIDAFSGAGIHISKTTKEYVLGSPLNALLVDPPFREYHFIDLNSSKTDLLRELVGDRPDVHIYSGDCNDLMISEIIPNIKYELFRRGLCLLDPYGLDLKWSVIEKAGNSKAIDLFLNFPIMAMNRTALWRDPSGVNPRDVKKMNDYWGDNSWQEKFYQPSDQLSFLEDEIIKSTNEEITDEFRKKLRIGARFDYVPAPIPMRNSKGSIIYYLFFASQNKTANKIIQSIFRKYQNYPA